MSKNQLTKREIACLASAVIDAYLGFDSEDYCEKGIGMHGTINGQKHRCYGCIQYKGLQEAYKIAKKILK